MATEIDATCSKDFNRLKQLIESGKAKFDFNRFFLRNTFSSWLIYRGNETVTWIYSFFHIVSTEWFSIPFSIILAWWFHAWWMVILGVAFSWTFDSFIKMITPDLLRRELLRDENFLNHLWGERPFRVMILSTKMKPLIYNPEEGSPVEIGDPQPITILPHLQPWQSAVNEIGLL